MKIEITRTKTRFTTAMVALDGSVDIIQHVLVNGEWVSRHAVLNADEWARIAQARKEIAPSAP